MKIVLALGGNALLQRSQDQTLENQLNNIKDASASIVQISEGNELVIVHGNGPQVGMLMEQNATYHEVKPHILPYPMDVLSAETCGMIGCLLQQELLNANNACSPISVITQTLVEKGDPAFENPTKFVGPVYSEEEARKIMQDRPNLQYKPDGEYYRQVVASPKPKDILEIPQINTLLSAGNIVIAGGGGGIPVYRNDEGKLNGVECVIDKDYTAEMISEMIEADLFIILTDGDVCENYGTPEQRSIKKISYADLRKYDFPAGSMGPKVDAVCKFVKQTGNKAVIGSLYELDKILAGTSGTSIETDCILEYYNK
ncbi:carbamate kinase [Moritella sp. Urea-trap-13]|uniref:carbamate kinase n=1 Tax=Moritella sp. Urea-trap-13 TaxID=2058327 RepID=UPI000C333F95|nr:carbamate kinase [Moritella sp. Urea-trap-13]PKH07547.1 carbamate kinase [Moritella sp. Urea-trap-13]